MAGIRPASASGASTARRSGVRRPGPPAPLPLAGGAGTGAPFGGAAVPGNVPLAAATSVLAAGSDAGAPDAGPEVGGAGRWQNPCPQDLAVSGSAPGAASQTVATGPQVLPAETTGPPAPCGRSLSARRARRRPC